MAERDHWNAEQNSNYRGADGAAWVIRYDPTPAGKKNADGSTTYSMNFPALQVLDWVADPEAVAKDIARDLNCHDDLVAALKALTTTLRHCGLTEALMSSVGAYRGQDGNFVHWAMSDLMEQADAALAKADAGTVRLGEIG